MNRTAEILIEAQTLIRKPSNWVKGYDAMGELGGVGGLRVESPLATRFCARGAIKRVSGYYNNPDTSVYPEYLSAKEAIDEAAKTDNSSLFETIVNFNDRTSTTHEDIMRVFDSAISKALNE